MRTGLNAALAAGATQLVILDGDGQHNADEIPLLLKGLAGGHDLVIGSRVRPGDGAPSLHRRVGRLVLDGMTNTAGGTKLRDTQSGFRAFTREATVVLMPEVAGMGVESRMLMDAARQGLKIAEVEITEHYPHDIRPPGAPLRHAGSVIGTILSFVRDEHPLALFGLTGLLAVITGAFLGAQTAAAYWELGVFWPGKAMLSMLGLTLGSVSIATGLLLNAIRSRRP